MKKTVTVQLEEEELEKLKALAKDSYRTVASQVRQLIIEFINRNEKIK